MTPIQEIIDKLRGEQFLCSRELFPIINRNLNDHGYKSLVVKIADGIVDFLVVVMTK